MKIKLPTKEEQYQWLIVIGIFCPIAIETSILILLIIWTLSITGSLKLNKYLVAIIICIFFMSIIEIHIVDYKYTKFIQQFVLCTFYIVGYYNIIQSKYFEINNVFNKIVKISVVISWIGIIQFLFSLLTSYQLSDSNYLRATSIMAEPGYLARCLFPSLVFIVLSKNWKRNKVNTLSILICFFLTQSAVGYIVLMIFITYYLYFYEKFMYFFKITIAFCIVMSFIILPKLVINPPSNTDNEIIKKTTETFLNLKNLDPSIFETLNLSSYAFLTNLSVSINSPLRIFGTGLGTHSQNYFNTINYSTFKFYGLNSDDAFSLAIRLYSEFGLMILFFVYILLRKLDIKDPISASLFFTIIFILLRGGHYTQYGTIFIIMLYFSTAKKKIQYMN